MRYVIDGFAGLAISAIIGAISVAVVDPDPTRISNWLAAFIALGAGYAWGALANAR